MVLRVIYVRPKGSMTPLALPGDNKLAEKHAKKQNMLNYGMFLTLFGIGFIRTFAKCKSYK